LLICSFITTQPNASLAVEAARRRRSAENPQAATTSVDLLGTTDSDAVLDALLGLVRVAA
jgi:hypothetical protein